MKLKCRDYFFSPIKKHQPLPKQFSPISFNDFIALPDKNVVDAKISDHHPVIHNGVLFWNVMMQGKMRPDGSYNNGFGIIETEQQYLQRLIKICCVIAKIIWLNPTIETIGLCEGPIHTNHLQGMIDLFKQFPWMRRFISNNTFHQVHDTAAPNWGLLMMTDKKYQVSKVVVDLNNEKLPILNKLTNRFQLWQLKSGDIEKYFALAHFPFGSDESVTEQHALSKSGKLYSGFIQRTLQHYANQSLVFCADFNFNPYLIHQWHERVLDHIPTHNSLLLVTKTQPLCTKTAMVDGVLLSNLAKQQYCSTWKIPNLFKSLAAEYKLLMRNFYDQLEMIPGAQTARLLLK